MTNERNGWDDVCIADFGEIVAGGTPSRAVPSFWNGTIPWVTPGEITQLKGKYLRETREQITEAGLAGSSANLLPEGSVLVTTRATLGEVAIASVRVTTNQGFKSIIPNERTDSLFAYYRIGALRRELEQLSSGTTFLEISKADFARIRTRRPLPREQRRIAAVLDTVDTAIGKTEAVIAKLKQVRAGLLHDLLTCGLDENGQLRDPLSHPDQFKDSVVGRIPIAWQTRPCETLCKEIVVGIVIKPAQYYVDDGVPVLRSANVREEGLAFDDLVFISIESNNLLRKSILRAGDVVTVRTGYPGTTCVIPQELDGSNCVDLVISRPGPEVVSGFLALWVNSPFGKDQVLRVQGGLAQQHFNVGEMKRLFVAKPSIEEQRAIVARVDEVSVLLRREREFRSKLGLLKHGIMTDLLGGRVRVAEAIGSATA